MPSTAVRRRRGPPAPAPALRVVLADGSCGFRDGLGFLLRTGGADVVSSVDGSLALHEAVAQHDPDVVVVDPPRAGLSQKIVRRIAEMEPRRIVYVSCNPTTLAPNARQLVEAGWTLQRVQPVDMFPQTPHIECVALLSR